ncbi:MAG: hypothetical protein H6716_05380 [Polyangiaceae bacterium]|nr:hypothetical protein [Polyangiaceae bacterium]
MRASPETPDVTQNSRFWMVRGIKRRLASIAVAAACSLATTTALAHGAFPQSAFVYEDPSDANRLWVGASFGLLTSPDRGDTWYWLCEEAPDYEGVKPKLDVSANGALLVGSFDGVSVSSSLGCDWTVPDGPKDKFVSYVHTEQSDPHSVLALVSMGQPGNVFLNQVWASANDGQSFTQLGADLDTGLLAFAVVSAKSDGQRIYVTGNLKPAGGGAAEGMLLVSSDRGQTWDYRAIPGADSTNPPHVLGVHPTDPDQVFVRIDGDARDQLLVSNDAGQSFTQLLDKQAELFGFAVDPDGTTLRIGFGDARDPTLDVDENDVGIYSSAISGLSATSFTRDLDGAIGCLRWIGPELYACTSQFFHGYELGRSTDGKTFEPVMTLSGVDDVLSCPAESRAGQYCPAKWPSTCALIGKCVPGEDAGAGGSAGNGSGGTSSGSGGSNGGGDDGGGCGCRMPGADSTSPASDARRGAFFAGLALILAGLWSQSRRKKHKAKKTGAKST